MTMHEWTSRLPAIASTALTYALLSGCSGASNKNDPQSPSLITESEGLAISRRAAREHGYDLERFKRDTFGDSSGGGDKAWLFGYLCSPGPPPPGCGFLVVVDRRTGEAEVHPGQ